jgi:hypothetical protein
MNSALTLVLTYVVGVLASRWLVFRAFALDAPAITAMIAVPLAQIAALALWRRRPGRRRP